mgnify:CR=1 FL=1
MYTRNVIATAVLAVAGAALSPGATAQGDQAAPGAPRVGEPPPETEPERPEVQAIADVGGVLTPEGVLVVEPAFQFSNSQVNRFTFLGTEILSTFLVGLIEAEDIDRDVFSPQLSLRYGLTSRLEAGIKIPWVYREEDREVQIPQASSGSGDSPVISENLTGEGLGDVELSLHWQINQGSAPYYVANLRYKSDTGTGPFDVDFNDLGLEEELATGSGFEAVEPSLTVLVPSDPAVFYGNIGYVYNMAENVDKVIGSGDAARRIGEVDPGDSLRFSFGMAVSLNPRASFNIGYKHEFIDGTDSEIGSVDLAPVDTSTSDLQVGSLLFGLSHKTGARSSLNVNLEVGATADAPDVALTVSLPWSFGP